MCNGLAVCSNFSTANSDGSCIRCPVCDSNGKPCPFYKCSANPRDPLYDQNGCQVCSACNPAQQYCPDSNCLKPESCGDCAELHKPRAWSKGGDCPDCRRTKRRRALKRCKHLKCTDPICTYGTYATVESHGSTCCLSCIDCQPSPKCESVVCATPTCPKGFTVKQQTNRDGCKLCPKCVACPVADCAQPTCGDCSEVYLPTLANGCHGCPECRAKCKVKTCKRTKCADPVCKCGLIAYIDQDSSKCCTGCTECQPSSICPNIVCAEPTCPAGSYVEQQNDLNGCKLCKICKRIHPPECPPLACEEREECNCPCSMKSPQTLPDGCPGCPICIEHIPHCRNCEEAVRSGDGCLECKINTSCTVCHELKNCPATAPVCGRCSTVERPTLDFNCPGCLQCRIKPQPKLCYPYACTPNCPYKTAITYLEKSCCKACTFECQTANGCQNLICDNLCPDGYKPAHKKDARGCIIACPVCVKSD